MKHTNGYMNVALSSENNDSSWNAKEYQEYLDSKEQDTLEEDPNVDEAWSSQGYQEYLKSRDQNEIEEPEEEALEEEQDVDETPTKRSPFLSSEKTAAQPLIGFGEAQIYKVVPSLLIPELVKGLIPTKADFGDQEEEFVSGISPERMGQLKSTFPHAFKDLKEDDEQVKMFQKANKASEELGETLKKYFPAVSSAKSALGLDPETTIEKHLYYAGLTAGFTPMQSMNLGDTLAKTAILSGSVEALKALGVPEDVAFGLSSFFTSLKKSPKQKGTPKIKESGLKERKFEDLPPEKLSKKTMFGRSKRKVEKSIENETKSLAEGFLDESLATEKELNELQESSINFYEDLQHERDTNPKLSEKRIPKKEVRENLEQQKRDLLKNDPAPSLEKKQAIQTIDERIADLKPKKTKKGPPSSKYISADEAITLTENTNSNLYGEGTKIRASTNLEKKIGAQGNKQLADAMEKYYPNEKGIKLFKKRNEVFHEFKNKEFIQKTTKDIFGENVSSKNFREQMYNPKNRERLTNILGKDNYIKLKNLSSDFEETMNSLKKIPEFKLFAKSDIGKVFQALFVPKAAAIKSLHFTKTFFNTLMLNPKMQNDTKGLIATMKTFSKNYKGKMPAKEIDNYLSRISFYAYRIDKNIEKEKEKEKKLFKSLKDV